MLKEIYSRLCQDDYNAAHRLHHEVLLTRVGCVLSEIFSGRDKKESIETWDLNDDQISDVNLLFTPGNMLKYIIVLRRVRESHADKSANDINLCIRILLGFYFEHPRHR